MFVFCSKCSKEEPKLILIRVKVCHSSAFQTISVRLVYVNIINDSGSILANSNYTMHTK